MATEADIPAPICEKIREEGENIVYQATNISLYKLPKEEKTQGDYTPNELPTIVGEIFLTTPSISEVHYEANNISPISSKEGENLNVEVTTSNDNTGNAKTTKEDIPCNLISDVSKNGESPNDQNKITSEHEELGNERNLAENLDKAAEKVSQENNTRAETIIDATSNNDELQGKNDLNASFCKEEYIPVQEGDEQLEKESEKLPLTEVSSTEGTNDNESTVIHKFKIEDEDLGKVEVFENEKNTCTLLKEEAQLEETVESLHVVSEDIKASNPGQETKTASSPEERSINANLQGITTDNIDEKTIDAVDTQNGVLEVQNFSTIVSNEEIEANSTTKVDSPEMKHEEHLEKESQEMTSAQPLATEASGDESKVIHEARVEDEELKIAELCENEKSTENIVLQIESKTEETVESLYVSSEDIKACTLGQEIETTSSGEEQSPTAHQQGILDEKTEDRTVDAAETEETLEVQNVATTVSNEKNEEDSMIQVDDSQLKDEEHLEKESEKPSLIKYSTVTHEVKIEDENAKRAELFEKEKNIESTLLKEEVQIEKPVESFHAAIDDIKAPALEQHTEITSSVEEQNLTENTQGIPCDEAEEKTIDAADTKEETVELQNVMINVSNKDIDENALIQVDDSQMKHEEHLEEEIGKPSLTEALTEEANDDESTIVHEVKFGDECLTKAELSETEENAEITLLEKEAMTEEPIGHLQVTHGDNKQSASSDTGITCCLEEQSQIANPQAIIGDKTLDANDTAEVTLENVAIIIPHEDTEENPLNQVDCSPMEHGEHLEKESENPSLKECSTADTNEDEPKTMHESEIRDENLTKAELLENEKNIESTFEKEEAVIEQSIDSLQVAAEDIEASASGQDTETSSIEEQIPTVNRQEIFCGKTEEKTIDAADTKDETFAIENVAINVSSDEIDKNSSIQVDGSQIEHEAHLEKEIEKSSSAEASIGGANEDESIIIHEAEIGNADLKNVELFDNDTNIDNSLLKKEAMEEKPIEYLQVATDDDKTFVSSEGTKKTYSLEEKSANVQEIVSEKIIDATEEVTLEVEKVETTIPHEETQENSLIQVDCSKTEYEEHLEKESHNPSLTEASTGNANEDESKNMHERKIRDEDLIKAELLGNDKKEESTLVNEAALKEETIDSLQVATEDIKVYASDQDPEISSIDERILTVNPKEISGNKTEETKIDAADTEEETLEVQNVSTNVPNGDNEDNSANQIDGSQMKHEEHLEKESEKLYVTEASTGITDDHKSTVHEAKFVDEELTKADLSENEKDTGSALVKEPSIESVQLAPEDIKESASGQDRETSSLEEQCLTENPREIMGDNEEDETNDATQMNEETPEDKIVAVDVSNEETEENSLIQLDGSQLKSETHMERESEKLDENANDESKIMHETSALEEGLSIKDDEICTGKEDHVKDVANQENQYNPVTSNGATEDQSKETEEKVDEDPERTVTGDDVEMQMTGNEHHVEAHSEFTEDETIKISSELGEIYEESNDNRDDSTETINKEIKVETSIEDKKKEMEADTEVSEETENAVNTAKTIEINDEEGYLKNLQMTTAVDIAAHEEKGSESRTTENLYTKGSDVNKDMVVTVAEGPNCEQEESSTTDVSEEDTRINNENVVNITSLASEASEVNSEKTDVEEMGVLDDVSTTKPANENLVEAFQKESTETQVPDGEKEAELMQHDPEAETGEKEIKDEQPINTSQDVSESNEVNGQEEKRDSDSCKEESDNSNTLAFEEAENKEAQKQHDDLHILADINNLSTGETEKDVPLCGATVDESDIPKQMQKTDEISLPAPDENIIEKTDSKESKVAAKDKYAEHLEQEDTTESFLDDQKPPESEQEEAQCRQEKVILDEKTEEIKDSTSILVVNDFPEKSSKETSEMDRFTSERELTINREELHMGKTALGEDEEEEADKQKKSDFSPAAPVMTEARDHDDAKLLYEAPEETFTCKVAGEGNIVKETTDTTESTVMNNNTGLEDSRVNSKSIGELETKLEDDALETIETTPDAIKGQQGEITSVRESPVLVSERAESEHAFGSVIEEKTDSNEVEFAAEENKTGYEFKDQHVKELIYHEIPLQGNNTEKGVTRGYETGYETKCASVEEVTEDNITSVPEEQLQKAVLLNNDLQTSLEIEKFTDEITNKMASEAEEKSMKLGQEVSSKDEEILNYKADDAIDSNTVSKEIHEPEKLEKVLEYIAQVENCDIISKADEVKTEEENLEAAKEIKSDKIVSEERIKPKETTYEAEETMKVDILNEKIEEAGDNVQDFPLGSCKEEVIRASHLEDEIKQEIHTEENFEVIKNANENVKNCKVIEEANDKAVEEREDTLLANESIQRSLHQNEQVVSVEDSIDHVCIKTGTEDSIKEVNSSDVAFVEDEHKKTGADDLDIEMTKDEGLPNEDSNISEIDAVARELPKLDENIICEDAPTTTVHITIKDPEINKGNANTIMIQQQEDDNKSKHESLPLPEFTQGKESEEQDQKYENCSSEEVQAKEEENVMLAEGTSEEEAQKAHNWRKPTEDEDRNTYIEAEKLDFSSQTMDKSEVSCSYDTQDIPKDNEKYIAKNECSEKDYPNESTESQISTVSEDVEVIEQASKATTIDAAAVLEETGGDSRQAEEVKDECKGMTKTSTSTESTKISTSKIMEEYTVVTSLEAEDQETQDQLTKLHDLPVSDISGEVQELNEGYFEVSKEENDLPQESHVKDSEVKMTEKDGPVDLERVGDIREDVQELNEGPVEVSKEENDLPQESHVKDSEMKMAEKDGAVDLQSVSDISEEVQELHEGSVEVSKEENDLPQRSHVKDSEVKIAEKDGPVDLQSVSAIREGVQELNEGSVEVPKEENPIEADPSDNIEAKYSSGGQKGNAIQRSPISETLKQEIEEPQGGRTSLPISEAKEMNCEEEEKIGDNYNDLTETSRIVTKEMVSESNTHQTSMEDAAKSAIDHESIKCSDTEIAEKDLPMHFSGFGGTDVKELEVTAEDKHAVPEAGHIENVNPEIGDTNISVIQHGDPAECSQDEDEILKPSKPEQGEAKCETTKSGGKSEPTETDKPSISDLLQVSTKETSRTADHSANEKEPTIHGEHLQVEKPNEIEHEEAKTDEEKDNEGETCEQNTSDLGSEAPVMVDAGDADVKVAHKKSHNILSGVGSKVKHSIAKVKKVITGKSSHPKPPSPKSGEKY